VNGLYALGATDAAIFAALMLFRLTRPDLFGRVFRCAVILAGIEEALASVEAEAEAEAGRCRRLAVRLRGVPGIVRAAVTPHPGAVPVPCRLMIAAGAAVPIIGPIDEAGAVAAVAGLTLLPEYRARVVGAWARA
jgi:hypothetical protein